MASNLSRAFLNSPRGLKASIVRTLASQSSSGSGTNNPSGGYGGSGPASPPSKGQRGSGSSSKPSGYGENGPASEAFGKEVGGKSSSKTSGSDDNNSSYLGKSKNEPQPNRASENKPGNKGNKVN